MPAINPRVNAVLEPPLYRAVARLARAEGVSLSQKVRDLIRDAVELAEDEGLALLAEPRFHEIKKPGVRWLAHQDVKRRCGGK